MIPKPQQNIAAYSVELTVYLLIIIVLKKHNGIPSVLFCDHHQLIPLNKLSLAKTTLKKMTALHDIYLNGHFCLSPLTNDRFCGNKLIRSLRLWVLIFIFSNGHCL